MRLSRRAFLVGGSLAAMPCLPLGAATPVDQPKVVGELWGMPYLAPGALGNLPAGSRT
ncbi:hypothetical protein [Alteraurantiacibacter buctensis]|uniref:Uncharacterized protein n=1 Tax=Alteraurantiacibacter buctensis TaxID=1503981 RepID=A0A844YYX2_9SPHN|nr:hypothetical protein [Alteraurantiacibacter buctensis]MXO71981.1 hypothetical protein [Alteraurantiacibacter buctensis]